MANFEEVTLGDVVNLKRGYDLPKKARLPGPYPVVSSSGRTGFHAEWKVEPPGVVTGRYGTIGEVFYVDEPYWPLNTTLYVQDFKGNDPHWVAGLLESLDLATLVSSAAVPGVNRNHLHPLIVRRPDLNTQGRIGCALRAFDELIENNGRRIDILEDIARLLYREWFVHFRFPGHEDVELVDSELGPIPEGWERRRLGDVAENYDRKRVPLSKMQRAEMQGPYPYYGAAKIFDYVDDYIFDGEYLLLGEDGTVVDGSGGPMLQLVNGKFWCNNHAHVLRGTVVSTRRLWCALLGYPIAGHVTGAAQPKITQTNMNRIPILVPGTAVADAFDAGIAPMIDLRFNLERQNRVLRETRDLLLPRLVSGELDVSELDLDGVLA